MYPALEVRTHMSAGLCSHLYLISSQLKLLMVSHLLLYCTFEEHVSKLSEVIAAVLFVDCA